MDADMLSVYGLDIADLGTPRLPVRRFCALVWRLPPEARVWSEEDSRGWGVEAYLLADIFHAVSGSAHPSRPRMAADRARQRDVREKRKKLEALYAGVA